MLVGAFHFPTDYGIEISELARALEARGFESLFHILETSSPLRANTNAWATAFPIRPPCRVMRPTCWTSCRSVENGSTRQAFACLIVDAFGEHELVDEKAFGARSQVSRGTLDDAAVRVDRGATIVVVKRKDALSPPAELPERRLRRGCRRHLRLPERIIILLSAPKRPSAIKRSRVAMALRTKLSGASVGTLRRSRHL